MTPIIFSFLVVSSVVQASTRKEVCFPDELPPSVACFKAWPNQDTESPGVTVMPESPAVQNITFRLYSLADPRTFRVLTPGNLRGLGSAILPASSKIAFVVHGFAGENEEENLSALTSSLLTQYPNVVVVDWLHGARGPPDRYPQAAQNTRVVGAYLAALVNDLVTHANLSLDNLHLLGHSLGAHVAGYAGQDVLTLTGKKVGRISGLDPAGKMFEDFGNQIKLDPSDARFVDVIHTKAGVLGTTKSDGHVDFWPNNGTMMPECLQLNGTLQVILCSHARAIDYFTASVEHRIAFMASPCSSASKAQAGSCEPQPRACANQCNRMGFWAEKYPSGNFVLDTSDDINLIPLLRQRKIFGLH